MASPQGEGRNPFEGGGPGNGRPGVPPGRPGLGPPAVPGQTRGSHPGGLRRGEPGTGGPDRRGGFDPFPLHPGSVFSRSGPALKTGRRFPEKPREADPVDYLQPD